MSKVLETVLLLVGLTLLFQSVVLAASVVNRENGVLVLDSDSLDEVLEGEGLVMIDFYAPWCGHCQQLEPEYAEAAKELENDDLVLGKVNCDAEEKLCSEDRWDIEGFPAIKVVRGDTIHDYNGPRSAQDIAAFMREVATFDPDNDFPSLEDDIEEDDDGMLILGTDDLDAASKHFVIMMIVFFVPGCEGCAALEEELVEASDELYKHYIPVAKVDCYVHKMLCEQSRWDVGDKGDADAPDDAAADASSASGGVKKRPASLVVLRDGEVFDFGARPRKAYNMVAFVKNLAGIDEGYVEYGEKGVEEDDDDDQSDSEIDETNVLVLDPSTIEAAIRDNEVMLVEFYAPWCGVCQRVKPLFARAANELVSEGIRLAKIDCQEHDDLCLGQPYKVRQYPTMFLHRRGKVFPYEGEPDRRGIVKFMRDVAKPSPTVVSSMEEMSGLLAEHSVFVVGFFHSDEDSGYNIFKEVADDDVRLAYGASFDEKVRRKSDARDANKVVVFKNFEETRSELTIKSFTSKENMKVFIANASQRLVLEMGSQEASSILSKKPLTMFLMTEDEEKPSKSTWELLSAGQALSKAAVNAVTYVHAPLDKNGEGVFDFVVGENNRKGTLPCVALVSPGPDDSTIKYLLEGDLSLQSLQEFERRYFAGELTPHMKSEKVSDDDTQRPVKIVKGESFRSIVLDNDQDVLLEFYAPWCAHCRRLEPIYEQFAMRMHGRETLVVAKMDHTANDADHPEVKVKGLPTLLLFKAQSKDTPIKFSGEHDLESLEAFVNENANHKAANAAASIHTEL